MYLSQLVIDPRAPGLEDPYNTHRTLLSAFPEQLPAGERVLFRLEQQARPPRLVILVQSHTLPDWNGLYADGRLLRLAEIKQFDLRPAAGEVFQFRLAANPTKRLKGDGQKDGPRVGLAREEDQLEWLRRKGALHGFAVLAAQTVKLSQPDGWKQDGGGRHRIRLEAVRFDGRLQVIDPDSFAKAVTEGIGSGKGFGFGLLSLARAE